MKSTQRQNGMSEFQAKTIVVPVDFSDESIAAVGTAVDIASSPSDVHVVHVIPHMNVAESGLIWQEIDDNTRKQHSAEALREQLSDKKYARVHIYVEVGDPGHCVVEFAERIRADLIVMPSHGRTGLSHILVGSVAERVVRLSHCPVLVLKK
jgi:nucleotide-binding universal stress UspA family protein